MSLAKRVTKINYWRDSSFENPIVFFLFGILWCTVLDELEWEIYKADSRMDFRFVSLELHTPFRFNAYPSTFRKIPKSFEVDDGPKKNLFAYKLKPIIMSVYAEFFDICRKSNNIFMHECTSQLHIVWCSFFRLFCALFSLLSWS